MDALHHRAGQKAELPQPLGLRRRERFAEVPDASTLPLRQGPKRLGHGDTPSRGARGLGG